MWWWEQRQSTSHVGWHTSKLSSLFWLVQILHLNMIGFQFIETMLNVSTLSWVQESNPGCHTIWLLKIRVNGHDKDLDILDIDFQHFLTMTNRTFYKMTEAQHTLFRNQNADKNIHTICKRSSAILGIL